MLSKKHYLTVLVALFPALVLFALGYARLARDAGAAASSPPPSASTRFAETPSNGSSSSGSFDLAARDSAGEREPIREGELDAPRLHGIVVSLSGKAIAGAEVSLLRPSGDDPEKASLLERAVSGRGGRFGLSTTEPSRGLLLSVEAHGYRQSLLEIGEEREIHVTLAPQQSVVTLTGRVVDAETGRIIEPLEIRDVVYVPGTDGMQVEATWKSLPQTPQGFVAQINTLGGEEAHFSVRALGYPGVTRDLDVVGKERIDVGEIALRAGKVYGGRVVDERGNPIGNASVMPVIENSAHGAPVHTRSSDGAFELSLTPKHELTSLYVSAQGYAPSWVMAKDVGATWDDVVVRMDQGARIDGQVVRGGGLPVAETEVRAWALDPDGNGLPGGARGSTVWSKTTRTDRDGLYHFDQVPRTQLGIGVGAESSAEDGALERIQSLAIESDALYLCDFWLGGGAEIRGSIEMPLEPGARLSLSLHADESSSSPALASLEATIGQPFLFEDVPPGSASSPLVLRISMAPGFYVAREIRLAGSTTDLGPIRFPTFKSLTEFNRGGRKIVGIRETE